MVWLLAASLVWGLSFGLIKGLIDDVDPFFLGLVRTAAASLFFLPWLIRDALYKKIDKRSALQAAACGFIQIGLMYGPYLASFRYLKSHEVALFTMTTPLIMSVFLIFGFGQLNGKAMFRLSGATMLATIGGVTVAWNGVAWNGVVSQELLIGIGLVQLSNALFALGLLMWMHFFGEKTQRVSYLMCPYFVGAFLASVILTVFLGKFSFEYTRNQWLVFLWLGVVASGLGFYLWNRGALQVSRPLLAVANNIKLPIAIFISVSLYGEAANYYRLATGIFMLLLAIRLVADLPRTKSPH